MQIAITPEELETIRSALEFYANGDNQYCLHNPKTLDCDKWEDAIDILVQRGFAYDNESYDGSEWYLETGKTAREALELINKIEDRQNEN